MSRAEDSEKRRREILAAALDCFHAHGYEKTTLADIRDRAGASIGSIYHLFDGKEQLFAALYLEAIAASQGSSVRALRRKDDLESGVHALVRSYLRWVSRNRKLAGYLLTMRRAEFMSEAESELAELNEAFRRAIGDWLDVPYYLPDAAQHSGLSQYELLTTLGNRFARIASADCANNAASAKRNAAQH